MWVTTQYQEGQRAKKNGVAESDCPYQYEKERAEWLKGWNSSPSPAREATSLQTPSPSREAAFFQTSSPAREATFLRNQLIVFGFSALIGFLAVLIFAPHEAPENQWEVGISVTLSVRVIWFLVSFILALLRPFAGVIIVLVATGFFLSAGAALFHVIF